MKKIIFESGLFKVFKDEELKNYTVMYPKILEIDFNFIMNGYNCILCIGSSGCLLFDKGQNKPICISEQYVFQSIVAEDNGFKFLLDNGLKRFYEKGEFLSVYPKEVSYRDLTINKEFIIARVNENQEVVYLRNSKKLLTIRGYSFFTEVSWNSENIHCVSDHSEGIWNIQQGKWQDE